MIITHLDKNGVANNIPISIYPRLSSCSHGEESYLPIMLRVINRRTFNLYYIDVSSVHFHTRNGNIRSARFKLDSTI